MESTRNELRPGNEWIVREFDSRNWHSRGVAGDTAFGEDRASAENYLRKVKRRLKPHQSAMLMQWRYDK